MKEYGGCVYTKDKKVKYPAKQKVRGLFEMPAVRNLRTDEVTPWFFDWKNSFIVIECFEDLLKKYPDKEIYVFADNWSAHKSYTIKVWNFFHPRLHIEYFPTNASWMNGIERKFSKLDREILKNSNFQTVREAIERISNYFRIENELTIGG